MEIWLGNKKNSILRRIQCAYSYSKTSKEVFNVQGDHKTVSTIVDCQAFSIITRNHQRDCSLYQSQEHALSSSLGFISVNLRQYPVVSERTMVCFIYEALISMSSVLFFIYQALIYMHHSKRGVYKTNLTPSYCIVTRQESKRSC